MSIHLVKEFATKFELPAETQPSIISDEDFLFRYQRLLEEAHELYDAHLLKDIVGIFDALLDTAYIVYGTALRMGISPEQWEQGMSTVHAANMAKTRITDIDESRYKNVNDIVKPAGWVGPEATLKKILSV